MNLTYIPTDGVYPIFSVSNTITSHQYNNNNNGKLITDLSWFEADAFAKRQGEFYRLLTITEIDYLKASRPDILGDRLYWCHDWQGIPLLAHPLQINHSGHLRMLSNRDALFPTEKMSNVYLIVCMSGTKTDDDYYPNVHYRDTVNPFITYVNMERLQTEQEVNAWSL